MGTGFGRHCGTQSTNGPILLRGRRESRRAAGTLSRGAAARRRSARLGAIRSEQGSAGIVELNPQTVRSFFEDDANRAALRELFPGARQREEEARDWVQSARDLLQPMEVGRRFFLVPEWRDDPAPV